LWVGDITYIRLRGGTFCYLAVLIGVVTFLRTVRSLILVG
jgi:hypothetical protein